MGLTSAERKFIRGKEQVESICREARSFEDTRAYGLTTEREFRTAEQIEYTCRAVERKRPPDDWSLRLGEAIQNLRSALDHAVWRVSKRRSRQRTAFPIFIDACEFQVKGRPMIRGVPPEVRALIEEAQPFKTMPEHPRIADLALLSELSRIDKHRNLTAVAANVQVPFIGHDGPDSEIQFTDTGIGRELHEGAKVMAFTVTGPKADQVDVSPDFRYEVRVEGRPLIGSLNRIVYGVWKSVTECETGEPFPLMTPDLILLHGADLFPRSPGSEESSSTEKG